MQYTETEISKLIDDVNTAFTAELAKAEENYRLAKSEDGEKKPEPKKDESEHKPEGEKEAAPAAEAKPEGEAKPEAKPEGEMPPEGQAAAPAQAGGHDYDAEDMEHMKKMYMSMSEGELKAHHDCIASLAKCGDVSAAAPKGALGAKAPDSSGQPAVQKSEISSHDEACGGQIAAAAPPKAVPGAKSPASKVEGVQMEKSENTEVELLKSEGLAKDAKIEGLQKSLDAVSAFITKLVEKRVAPQGKAITSLEVIAKSEGQGQDEKTLTKGEIDAALSKKSQDPKLEKSERDLINAYYLSGASINSISHLLK